MGNWGLGNFPKNRNAWHGELQYQRMEICIYGEMRIGIWRISPESIEYSYNNILIYNIDNIWGIGVWEISQINRNTWHGELESAIWRRLENLKPQNRNTDYHIIRINHVELCYIAYWLYFPQSFAIDAQKFDDRKFYGERLWPIMGKCYGKLRKGYGDRLRERLWVVGLGNLFVRAIRQQSGGKADIWVEDEVQ